LPSSAKSVESIIQRGNPTSVPLPVAPRSLPAATPQPQGK
jgi:hypothetical protein